MKLNYKLISIAIILTLLLITGCVDKSTAITKCEEKGYQFYQVTLGCDTVCIDTETGEKHTYEGNCKLEIGN